MRADDYLDRLSAEAPGAVVELSEAACAAFPDDQRVLRARAVILRLAGLRRDAMAHLRSVLQRHPDAAWAHAQLGLVVQPTDTFGAIGHFRRALGLEPRNRDFRLALIHALARYMGDEDTLEEAYQLLRPMLADAASWRASDLHIAYHVLSRICAWDELDALGDPGTLGRKWAEAGDHSALLLLLGHRSGGGLLVQDYQRSPAGAAGTDAVDDHAYDLGPLL